MVAMSEILVSQFARSSTIRHYSKEDVSWCSLASSSFLVMHRTGKTMHRLKIGPSKHVTHWPRVIHVPI